MLFPEGPAKGGHPARDEIGIAALVRYGIHHPRQEQRQIGYAVLDFRSILSRTQVQVPSKDAYVRK
jgi:hypothetical protein